MLKKRRTNEASREAKLAAAAEARKVSICFLAATVVNGEGVGKEGLKNLDWILWNSLKSIVIQNDA